MMKGCRCPTAKATTSHPSLTAKAMRRPCWRQSMLACCFAILSAASAFSGLTNGLAGYSTNCCCTL